MPRLQPADHNQRMIDHQCVLGDRCHGAIRGIGPLGGAGAAELVTAGAVGDLLGTFLDHDGRPVDHPFNTCSVGLPAAVLASGGAEKVPMVRAALVGGYVNHLITDDGTAEALVT